MIDAEGNCMKCASIDIGTNSVRLLCGTLENGVMHSEEKTLEMTRLGAGVNETGQLSAASMTATLTALKSFLKRAEAYGAEQVYAMATSAVRDAGNGADFVRKIYEETGLRVEILTGEAEAEVGFLGVLSGIEPLQQKASLLVIDIGGGSTECILGTSEGIRWSKSLNIGAVRLTGAYIEHDPPTGAELECVQRAIDSALDTLPEAFFQSSPTHILGIGGTAATLLTMSEGIAHYSREQVHGKVVSLQAIEDWVAELSRQTVAERTQILGLDTKRADIILAGALIFRAILRRMAASEYIFSDYDNLEGYLYQRIGQMNTQG